MTTTHSLLASAGVLDLCERICGAYGLSLAEALAERHKGLGGHVRHVLYAALFVLGWRQARIVEVFGCDGKTVANALDSVRMREVRRFVPRKVA